MNEKWGSCHFKAVTTCTICIYIMDWPKCRINEVLLVDVFPAVDIDSRMTCMTCIQSQCPHIEINKCSIRVSYDTFV